MKRRNSKEFLANSSTPNLLALHLKALRFQGGTSSNLRTGQRHVVFSPVASQWLQHDLSQGIDVRRAAHLVAPNTLGRSVSFRSIGKAVIATARHAAGGLCSTAPPLSMSGASTNNWLGFKMI